jgi:hypothetical protein
MTHLEYLQQGLAQIEAQPDGKDSLYAQDLRGQIAAAKFLRDQTPTSTPEEKFFGGTRTSPNRSPEIETEEDGIRAEALRRLRVRQLLKGPPGQTPDSSK